MTVHNKTSVIREYCLARKIPYKFEGSALYIGKGMGARFCYRVDLVPWAEVILEIDRLCKFDNNGEFVSCVDNFRK